MATDDDAGTGAGSRPLPVRNKTEIEGFDIVKRYHRLLDEDAELTKPIAALEVMIEMLSHTRSQTVFETMELVKAQSEKLRNAVNNPIALSHGTELFQNYLLLSLKQPTPGGNAADTGSGHRNFDEVREHLIRNGILFAKRSKEQREQVAVKARRHLFDRYTILTHGGSRVVGTVLGRAKDHIPGDSPRRFKVIHVITQGREVECNKVVAALRAKGALVATIPESAVGYVMNKVDMVIVGAEAVLATGGIISGMGTYQLALLAQSHRKPFFVAAEQHKFGKTLATHQFNLGFEQDVLDFYSDSTQHKGNREPVASPVDYTPPELIESFFCNHGVLLPSAVAREILMDFTL